MVKTFSRRTIPLLLSELRITSFTCNYKSLLFIVLALTKTDKNTKIIKSLDLPEKYKNEFNQL